MPNSSLALSSLHGLYIGAECLVAVFATLGNVLVTGVVRLKAAPQSTTLCFLTALALADAAVGLLVMALAIVVSLGISVPACSCLFTCCLLVMFSNASILSPPAVATDRHLRVKLPTR